MNNLLKYAWIVWFSAISLLGMAQKSGTEISGDVVQLALPIAAFSTTLIWQDDSRATLQFLKTMGTSFVVTHSLKWIINKPRPNGGEHSFPSGHTSSAFTGAAFLERRYGWKVGIPSYLLASYVGWTRVEANKHDYWDVLGGAIIGIGSAYLFTKSYEKQDLQVSLGRFAGTNTLRIVAFIRR